MTKKIALSLVLAASFSLAACTSSEEAPVDNAMNAVDNSMMAAEDTMNAAGNEMGNMADNTMNAMNAM